MALTGLKRPAAANGASIKKQCTEVVKAMSEAELPYHVVEALKLAAPFALTAYADERHPHQVSIVGMVDEALNGVQGSLQHIVDDCQAFVSDKDAEKMKREKVVLQAAKDLMESKTAAASKEYEVYEATQEYAKTAATLNETTKKQSSGDKTYIKLEQEKTHLESMKARICETRGTKYSMKACTALEQDLLAYGLDLSLVKSLHLVLTKDLAERSLFDSSIMNELDVALSAKASSLDSKLADEESGKKAREEATVAARLANDSAKERLTALQEEMTAASRTVIERQNKVSAAEKSLKAYPSDMSKADSDLIDARDRLATFMAAYDTFNALKDRTTPPPPPPEQVTAEADVDAATAPAASSELER